MAFITWTDSLQVGFKTIDEQHHGLVDAINDLHAAMKQGKGREEVGKVLHFLKDYTVSHFRTEEAYMARHGYTGAALHMQIHKDLTRQVVDLVTKYDSGAANLSMKVMDFLHDWLVHHIQDEDIRLAKFLREKGVQA